MSKIHEKKSEIKIKNKDNKLYTKNIIHKK